MKEVGRENNPVEEQEGSIHLGLLCIQQAIQRRGAFRMVCAVDALELRRLRMG